MKEKRVPEPHGNGKRKRWSAAEKLRIVLEGMEPGVEVSDLCRREGVSRAMYYLWKRTLLGSAERIAALDSRVKLAVPVSAVTTFDYWIRTDVNWDWHQRPPGIRRRADIGTLLALHAPHPLLFISSRRGTDDQEFPLEDAEKSFQWARHVYGLFSAEDAAAHYESTTAHG